MLKYSPQIENMETPCYPICCIAYEDVILMLMLMQQSYIHSGPSNTLNYTHFSSILITYEFKTTTPFQIPVVFIFSPDIAQFLLVQHADFLKSVTYRYIYHPVLKKAKLRPWRFPGANTAFPNLGILQKYGLQFPIFCRAKCAYVLLISMIHNSIQQFMSRNNNTSYLSLEIKINMIQQLQ